jgi:uncharacterized membrane protein
MNKPKLKIILTAILAFILAVLLFRVTMIFVQVIIGFSIILALTVIIFTAINSRSQKGPIE